MLSASTLSSLLPGGNWIAPKMGTLTDNPYLACAREARDIVVQLRPALNLNGQRHRAALGGASRDLPIARSVLIPQAAFKENPKVDSTLEVPWSLNIIGTRACRVPILVLQRTYPANKGGEREYSTIARSSHRQARSRGAQISRGHRDPGY